MTETSSSPLEPGPATATAAADELPCGRAVRPARSNRVPALVTGATLGAALVAAGVAGGAWVEREYLRPTQPNAGAVALVAGVQQLQAQVAVANAERDALRRDLAATRGDIARLSERIAALDAAAARPALPQNSLDPAVLAGLERRLAGIEAAAAATPAGDGAGAVRLADLASAERIGALERAVTEARSALNALQARQAEPAAASVPRAAIAAVAAAQLRDRARGSASFASELAAFLALAGEVSDQAFDAALGRLGAVAEGGVPSLDDLRRRFPAQADAALAAVVQDAEGWAEVLLRAARGLVRVRRTGDLEGEGDSARLARARALLERDDLAGAVSVLDGASAAARDVIAGWLADARARLAATEAADFIAARSAALARAQ